MTSATTITTSIEDCRKFKTPNFNKNLLIQYVALATQIMNTLPKDAESFSQNPISKIYQFLKMLGIFSKRFQTRYGQLLHGSQLNPETCFKRVNIEKFGETFNNNFIFVGNVLVSELVNAMKSSDTTYGMVALSMYRLRMEDYEDIKKFIRNHIEVFPVGIVKKTPKKLFKYEWSMVLKSTAEIKAS